MGDQSWIELDSDNQIAELMRAFGNFHDGCVREIHVVTGHFVDSGFSMTVDWRTTIQMLVQRQLPNPAAIEIRFEEVVALNVRPPAPGNAAVIADAACFLRDGIVYWADSELWAPESREPADCTWVAAGRASWRAASQWMGPDLRYGYAGPRR